MCKRRNHPSVERAKCCEGSSSQINARLLARHALPARRWAQRWSLAKGLVQHITTMVDTAACEMFRSNCPLPLRDYPHVVLSHGGGGRLSAELVEHVFLRAFGRPHAPLADSTPLSLPGRRIAVSTDSFVVRPLFFPGGSIGDLAVNGTVNDLAMSGAVPLWLSVGMIIEEGLPMQTLIQVTQHMAAAAKAAGVDIVTGDTKVVDKGHGD